MGARRVLPAVLALLALAPAARAADSGGAQAPAADGGAQYGSPAARGKSRRDPRPVLTEFKAPAAADLDERSAVTFRISARTKTVRVWLDLHREGERARAASFDLGRFASRDRVRVPWQPSSAGLSAGAYSLRLRASDERGRSLRRSARASARAVLVVRSGRFPIAGAYDFGGDGSRFGADRPGHIHQGQDLSAAEGTPVVAPRPGTVRFRKYQAEGAGWYVVLRDAARARDYVFMHLREGSIRVRPEQRVQAGELLAEVGSTGRSSGAHLHFEIWDGGWYEDGGEPIDPLPILRRWEAEGR